MIVFQPNIDKPTQKLVQQVLKDLMEKPENNALIDNYRQMKHQMAEAELRKAVREYVNEVKESQDYQDWLRIELKKDEHRRKKKVPADDLNRVKYYIKQKKSGLPAIIPTISHFVESTDRWKRTAQWRLQQFGYLSGLDVVDGDHVKNPEKRINEWLQRDDFKELGILFIFITPSGEGIKVVFKAREEWGNLQDNAYQMAEILGILDYCDSQTKNADHAHFIPKMSDVKYIDWDELFSYENPAYEARYGESYRRGESAPTKARWQELERQRKQQGKQGGTAEKPSVLPAPTSLPAVDAVELSEREQAIVKALNGHYGETVAEGHRHETFLGETAPWLLMLTDNNSEKALTMGQQLSYVKNWTDQSADELVNCITTVQKKPLMRRRPKKLVEILRQAGIDTEMPEVVSQVNNPMAELPFEQWCDKIESFFDVFPCLREVCEPHPRRLWPFLLFSSAAMLGTCMTLTYYYFYDHPGVRHRLNYIVLGVGDPTAGKGTLGPLTDAALAPIIDSDEIADKDTNDWKERVGATGANKEKETRHKIYARMFGPRSSNTEFIRSMMNCKEFVDGEDMNKHLITVDSEKDNSINMSKSGGWQNRDIMILKSFHNEWDDQHYANKESVSGRFRVYWNQIETCTPPTLRRLVNERNVNSGLDTRMAAIPMGKPDFGILPLEGDETRSCTAYDTIKQWSYRMDQRRGELPLWPLVEHVHKWLDQHRAIAEFNNDQAEWLLLKRVPHYGLSVAAPYVDMRHWEEREKTGTYVTDDKDAELCTLICDIQYQCQMYWFYELHRKYYDDQQRDATTYRQRTNRYKECFRQLPQEFTTEQFTQTFGYANNHSAQKPLQSLEEEKAIERTKRGSYKKLISEL